MKKWILLSILAVGMIVGLAACGGCSLLKAAPTPTQETQAAPPAAGAPPAEGNCPATNTDGAETVTIAGATFKMGSLASDPGAKANEQPQHNVTLGCYNIYKKEVTNAMYNKCVAASACLAVEPQANKPAAHASDPAYADYPVVGVDYNMASAYCTWARARLPTEAEWEYAARGLQTLAYPWGSSAPACTLANSKGCLTPEDTEKVGLLPNGQSPFTLLDMAGNAWEWVFDWYDASYYANSAGTNPTGPLNGSLKVVRGGGYNSVAAMLRTANRHAGYPYTPYSNAGFRCVSAPITLASNYVPPNPDLHHIPDGPIDDGDPDDPTSSCIVAWCNGPAPSLNVTYWPSTRVFVNAEANGNPLACSQVDPDTVECPLPLALQGTTMSGEACFDDGCETADYAVPVCTSTTVTPTSCVCRVTAPDCLTTSSMGFNVDTCVLDPHPLVPGSVTATDGINNYSCSFTGTVGQVYCGGVIPSSSGPLTVCFTQEGFSDQKCCYFPDFANSLPNCSNYNPNPQQPNCSQYTDANSCRAAGCTPNTDKAGKFLNCQ
jgi:formylglycine-generating enzyme required for sulfatase activity